MPALIHDKILQKLGQRAAELGMAPDALLNLLLDQERPSWPRDDEAFFQGSLELLCVANMEGYFVRVNPAFVRALGYSEEELLSTPFVQFVHPDDRKSTLEALNAIREQQYGQGFENRYRRKDGRYIWLQWVIYRFRPEEGLAFAGARDVTRAVEDRDALRRSEAQARLLLGSVPGGVLIVDQQGSITLTNGGAEDIFGYERGGMAGLSIETILPAGLEGVEIANYSAYLEGPDSQPIMLGGELYGLRKDGTQFPVELAINFAHLPQGTLMLVHVTDVTARRETERRERQQRLLAESLRDMAAELAGPLDLNTLLDHVMDHISRIIQHDGIGVILIDEDNPTRARITRPHNFKTGFRLDGFSFDIDNTHTLKTMIRSGQPLIIPDVDRFEGWIKMPGVEWIRCYMGAPIHLDGAVVGFIDLVGEQPGIFTEEHASQLQAFADQTGIGMRSARQHEIILRHAAELEQRVQDRTAELLEIKERLETILNNSSDAILLTDAEGLVQQGNRAFHEMFGYAPGLMAGQPLALLVAGEEHEHFERTLQAIITRKIPLRLEVRARRVDGSIFEADAALSPIEHEGLAGVVCSFRDITERKLVETALRLERDLLHQLMETSPSPIVVFNREGRLIYCNERALQVLGVTHDQALKRYHNSPEWRLATHEGGAVTEDENIFLRVLHTGRPVYGVHRRMQRSDGQVLTLIMNGAPVLDAEGEVDQVIFTIEDITDQQRIEESLRAALAHEKELGELKSRFISMVSHEFRTPLATILSSTELLKNYGHQFSEEKRLLHLKRIQTHVHHLTHMLEDVLVLGRAAADTLELKPSQVNLRELCGELVEGMLLNEEGRQIRLEISGCENIEVDEHLLRQILSNLISNALKYSPPDKAVMVALNCDGESIRIDVHDEGIGISEADSERLFDSFYRGQNVGNIPGTGLGLTIVQQSVQRLKGQISVHSQPGQGSTFSVMLPVAGPSPDGKA